jgi:WD40 repeat protein
LLNQSFHLALERFTNFGDLLRFLRHRVGLTQRELSIAVGYSHAQISRLELNQRLPDLTTISARFIPILDLENEPQVAVRLMELAAELSIQEVPSPGDAPFKGLSYFDETDAGLFFGREELVGRLLERVRAFQDEPVGQHFLAVVGASGSGKSSLVRAGLVPALRRSPFFSRGRVVLLTPTAHPLQALATKLQPEPASLAQIAALMDDFAQDQRSLHLAAEQLLVSKAKTPTSSRQSPRLLLVIDQFEELFTLCQDEAERQAFIANLMTAASVPDGSVCVVIALRADYYNACAPYPALRTALASQQEYIGPMNAAELRRAIEEPARTNHWELESGLVEILLKDLGVGINQDPQPGSLPLLSHALLETWQRRKGRTLTVSGYLTTGGIRSAIAETADRIYNDELDEEQQKVTRRIFLQLIQLNESESASETRRRATFEELIRTPADELVVREVLTLLADSRLVITNSNGVELAHEAIIREWPTLRAWLDEDREELLIARHLSQSAQSWERMDRDAGEVYRGARLLQARAWAEANPDLPNPLEKDFLAASLIQFEFEGDQLKRELDAAQTLADTRQHASQELRKRAIFLLVAFVLAVILAGVALFQGELARQSAITAQKNGQIAFSRELSAAALSSLDLDPERSILLGLRAAAVTQSLNGTVLPETEEALHRALISSRIRLTLSGQGQGVLSTAFSPDGKKVAGIGLEGKTMLWDASTGKLLLQMPGVTQVKNTKGIQRIAFSPDSSRVVTGDAQFVKIWDASSGQLIQSLAGHSDDVWAVAYSPDGMRIASGGVDGTVRFWDASSGSPGLVLTGFQEPVETLAFSPDGMTLAASSDDLTLKLWNTQNGTLIFNRATFSDAFAVTFSPDGKNVVTGSSEGVNFWDTTSASSDPIFTIQDGAGTVRFTSDGARLATINNSVVRLWDAKTGRELFTLSGHTGWVMDIAISPDGNRLASASMDGTVKIWSLEPGQEVVSMAGSGIRSAYSPNGKRLAQETADGALQIWNAQSGEKGLTLSRNGPAILGFAFSPDGTRIVTGGIDKTAKVWNVATGELLLTMTGHENIIRDVAYSRDGTRIATAGFDQTARIWDAASGKELLKLEGHQGLVTGVTFNSDGNRLATSSTDQTAKIWDTKTGRLLFTLVGHEAAIPDIAFSPDGTLLATGSQDKTARIWDAATGKELKVLIGHSSEIQSVAFSPDGTMLSTGSGDNTAILWDLATGKELQSFLGSAGGVMGVTFHPDGSKLALSSGDGEIRVYTLKTNDLLTLAQSRITRSLTAAECQKYLHSSSCPAGQDK